MSAKELDVLAASSNALRNLQRKLTLVQRPVCSIPDLNPIPGRLDDRFDGGVLTRSKKSVLPVDAYNKFSSELYPVPDPPRVDFFLGKNSRLIGRDPKVLY